MAEPVAPSRSDVARPRPGRPPPTGVLALLVFAGVLLVYARSPVSTVTDSVWVVPTALSLLDEHDADLDEYEGAIETLHGWQVTTTPDGRRFYQVPVATALVSLPFVALARAVDPSMEADVRAGVPTGEEPLIASVIVAATAAVVLLTAGRSGAKPGPAVVTALVFAFATSAWSTASRALWMHGPSMLFVSLSLYALVCARAPRTARAGPALAAAGACVAFAFFVRPTNAVVVVAFAVYTLIRHRRAAVAFVAGAAAVTAAFLALDLALYGSPLPGYISAGRLALSGEAAVALAGNLVSPARGLLVYSPVLVFAVAGFVRRRRQGTDDGLDVAVAAAVGAHLVVVSLFPHWWGGWSYGPRFMTDVLPLIVWFLPPALVGLRARPWALALFAVLAAWSVYVHARGATDIAGFAWNTTPVNVDADPGRLWDWSDPPFLR